MQSLYGYFFQSSKRHLEFTKLAHIMETKGNKDHVECENVLDLHVMLFKQVFFCEYQPLFMIMALDLAIAFGLITNLLLVEGHWQLSMSHWLFRILICYVM
jgi:hypothetical protein